MLSIVTFNVRTPAAKDGINFFPYRLPLIVQKIREELPDLIGFQELTQDSYEALSAMLPQYAFSGTGRDSDLNGESTRIAYLRDRFELLACEQFWLSPTPHVPGSRYEEDQSRWPRVCNMVRLYDKSVQEQFFMLNTHLDHIGIQAKEKGLKQIFDYIRRVNAEEKLPVFITGDFNFKPSSPLYALIAENGFTDLTEGIVGSFHDYGVYTNYKIDYILSDCPNRPFAISLWHEEKDGRFLSDHDAICAKG